MSKVQSGICKRCQRLVKVQPRWRGEQPQGGWNTNSLETECSWYPSIPPAAQGVGVICNLSFLSWLCSFVTFWEITTMKAADWLSSRLWKWRGNQGRGGWLWKAESSHLEGERRRQSTMMRREAGRKGTRQLDNAFVRWVWLPPWWRVAGVLFTGRFANSRAIIFDCVQFSSALVWLA